MDQTENIGARSLGTALDATDGGGLGDGWGANLGAWSLLLILGFIACLVMLPSAIASWYSKCYNIKLLYGFALTFSSVIVALMSMLFSDEVKFNLHKINLIATTLAVIYGVFLQFTGKCGLGN